MRVMGSGEWQVEGWHYHLELRYGGKPINLWYSRFI